MARRKVVLLGPMELAAGGTYTQPEREAVDVGDAKTATVFIEIYRNGSSSGSATLAIQTATLTPGKPYSTASAGFVSLGTPFTIGATTVGTQAPLTFTTLGELLRVTITPSTLNGLIQISITVLFTDT